MKLTYSEQLRHPNWQRRRLERLQVAEFTCENCSADDKTLHVHHRHYVKGRMAWEYSDDELQALCEDCHDRQHFERETLLAAVLMSPPMSVGEHCLAALIAGYLSEMGPASIAEPESVQSARLANPETYEAGATAARLEMEARGARLRKALRVMRSA